MLCSGVPRMRLSPIGPLNPPRDGDGPSPFWGPSAPPWPPPTKAPLLGAHLGGPIASFPPRA
eukprot:7398640-Pyramimonas_sp.AAC.1